MIEAIIGSLIAVVATGALALMAEVFTASQGNSGPKTLTDYEKELVKAVYSARHAGVMPGQADYESIEAWLADRRRDES